MDKPKKIDRDSLYEQINSIDDSDFNPKEYRRQEFDRKKRHKKNY